MRRIWGLIAGVIAVAACAVGSSLWAAGEPSCTGSVTAATPAYDAETQPNPQTTFTVTVSALDPATTRWKDIKITPPAGRKFPKYANPGSGDITVTDSNPPGSSQGWEHGSGSNGSIVVYTGTGSNDPNGFDNGTYTFTLDFEEDQESTVRSCNWELTDSGKKKDTTPIATDGVGPALSLPTLAVNMNGGAPATAAIGATTTVACVTEAVYQGREYEVYTSRSLNSEGTDARGIFINDTTDPIPVEWGITFNHSTGIIGPGGEPEDAFQVNVPMDPELAENSFYAVFAVKNGAGDIFLFSVPTLVTITLP